MVDNVEEISNKVWNKFDKQYGQFECEENKHSTTLLFEHIFPQFNDMVRVDCEKQAYQTDYSHIFYSSGLKAVLQENKFDLLLTNA